jgi:hypothetical protein
MRFSEGWVLKAIVGNTAMIKAYNDGISANGKPVPDGAAIAKIEWSKNRNTAAPYGVTVPGTQTEVSFMVKDSKRFPDTNGWGYAGGFCATRWWRPPARNLFHFTRQTGSQAKRRGCWLG